MECSTCKTPPQSGDNGSNGDRSCEEIIISFGRFGLGKDGSLMSQPSMIGSENVVPSSSGNDKPSAQKDGKLDVTEVGMVKEKECSSQGIEIDELAASIQTEWPPTNSVLQENIWAQPNIYNSMTLAENHHSSIQNPSASDWNNQSGVYRTENFRPVMGSQFSDGNHVMRGYRNFGPVMGSQFCDDDWSQIRNRGYFMNNNSASPNYFTYQVPQNSSLQPETDFLTMARTRGGSEQLQEVLEQGNYEWTQEILNAVLGSIFELMIDDNGHHVFGMLVEKCYNDQLFSIVSKADREPDTFIEVAFTDKGSKSIQRLIKRLKRSPMAETITRILSRRTYELLTHKTGSHVIRQCFLILGEKPNLTLYQTISSHLLELAIDPVGCISLNNFLDSITGPLRGVILNHLAEHSLFLSNDPSGNFVVQHMLNLNNKQVTETILWHLKGSFEQLAQKQGGSHVVEKCMRSSEFGLNLVVSEIFKDGKALFRLAKDQFGNYVIQTALKQTKMISDKNLYRLLLNALRPCYSHLVGKPRGRHVAELIRDDLGLQRAKSDE